MRSLFALVLVGCCLASAAVVPTLDQVNEMSEEEFVQSFKKTFEYGEWIVRGAFQARPFSSVKDLHDKMIAVLNSANREQQIEFLGHHPEVRGTIAAPNMTDFSRKEQAGLNTLTSDEYNELVRLNTEYRTKFGFPFMLSLRRHTKDMIFNRFTRRIANDIDAELPNALQEIYFISRLLLVSMITGPGIPKTTGSLTTHVLDTVLGKPAAGVSIELYEVSMAGSILLASFTTNADGRTDAPLISDQPLRIGTYELRFSVGSYFRTTSRQLMADPGFLDIVPIRFGIAEPESHYHVPLLVSPWSYSTYRGS